MAGVSLWMWPNPSPSSGRSLFSAWVTPPCSPHSGAQANAAVYYGLLEPGDTLLGMNLSHGGHLTHGHPVTFSGRWFKVVAYGVDPENHVIDLDEVESQAKEHRPKIIVVGASAYPRAIDYARFREIADEVGAIVMADIAHIAGLIAGGVHPNPAGPCADRHHHDAQDAQGVLAAA